MTQREALEAVRRTTHDYLAAVETDALDDEELEWLEWLQRRSVVHACEAGCPAEAVKGATLQGVKEVLTCRV